MRRGGGTVQRTPRAPHRHHPHRRPRLAAWVAGLWALLVLTGCVVVPTSGPAQPIEGQAPPCQNCVNVELAPPETGDEPAAVVEGYLRATSIYQPNYAVARQYLSKSAAEKWSPEDGAQIYSGSPVASGKNTVVLDGKLEGSLGPDRSYTAGNSARRWTFGMVKEDGEWRISTPPPGLMIAEFYFPRFYTTYNLYFIGNATLVPDPIYLPNLPTQALASVLMKALINGPTKWLQPAVTSALPADTALSVDSVTVENGVAQVPLSESVLRLSDTQRSLLAAQVVYTLRPTQIDGVVFTVNQKPFRVPESDESSFEVPVDSIPSYVAPVPFVAGEQLYAVRNKVVQLVDTNAGSPNPRPMPGPLGQGKLAVDSLAVSVTNTDIAVVTDGRTRLRSGTTSNGEVGERLSGKQNLLRPQFSRYGELWAIEGKAGEQHFWRSDGDKMVQVGAPLPDGGEITDFRISPDGTRVVLVHEVGQRSVLVQGRINRTGKVTVDGWRAMDLSEPDAPGITVIRDVAWLTANNMAVLGAATASGSMLLYEVSEDASVITAPSEANSANAVELTTLLGTETSVVIDSAGHAFKNDGAQWLSFLDKCTATAFPG